MKINKYHIICSRILLFCFIAGQCMIYAHSHPVSGLPRSFNYSKSSAHQTVQEKCYLCDVMHHNAMVISTGAFLNTTQATQHIFKGVAYNFTAVHNGRTSSRAPPSLIS